MKLEIQIAQTSRYLYSSNPSQDLSVVFLPSRAYISLRLKEILNCYEIVTLYFPTRHVLSTHMRCPDKMLPFARHQEKDAIMSIRSQRFRISCGRLVACPGCTLSLAHPIGEK